VIAEKVKIVPLLMLFLFDTQKYIKKEINANVIFDRILFGNPIHQVRTFPWILL
jgi:hypothetical protein